MDERSPPRKLAAILIADAVGFSRQMGEDEERTLRTFGERRDLIIAAIANRRGRTFGGAGDSVVAEFPSAVDALKASVEIQAAIRLLNEAAPEAERMLFRIGVNLGDVIIKKRNLFGDGVNIAERLQALANPGGICVSGSVHEQVSDKVPVEFVDLGDNQLKNIAHPVKVFLVRRADDFSMPAPNRRATQRSRRWLAVAGATLTIALALGIGAFQLWPWLTGSAHVEASGPPTVAVLPFANLSGDPGQDYFSDGVTRDIIASLGRFADLAVLSNNATAKFKGSPADSAELHQKLGARYVVAGSVRRSGDLLRVSVDLTDTDRGLQLWSNQFERKLTDIFAVQDEITRDITGALAIKLTRIEFSRALAKETLHLDAYDYYLRGLHLLSMGDRSDMLNARAMFDKAISLDPRYAAAISALGWTYHFDATSGWTEFAGDSLELAETYARQALSLSPELGDAHQLLGFVFLSRGEYDRALVEIRRAIEINPSDAYSYASLGTALNFSGDASGAITAFERARVFDPTLQPNLSSLGFAYYLAGRYEEAIATLEPLAGNSDLFAYIGLAAAYAELERMSDAERAAGEVKRLSPFFEVDQFVGQWKDEQSRQNFARGLRKAGLK
ncbi:adenylate/guanylate cyclase domain-containing protein [Mesorhizobium yinganensis]|uniref:adenylate/guanylate cyclase domain-containing protein n=1 Tax=Mesorhizobium yinganensis TaxID=3157707 RepID=UPI0032B75A15